jgi:hypothetical protein
MGLQSMKSVELMNSDWSSFPGARCQMSRLAALGILQGNSGTGTLPISLWAVGANGSAHAAATKVDAAIKRMANALASSTER